MDCCPNCLDLEECSSYIPFRQMPFLKNDQTRRGIGKGVMMFFCCTVYSKQNIIKENEAQKNIY
jgi:hypothetical protein